MAALRGGAHSYELGTPVLQSKTVGHTARTATLFHVRTDILESMTIITRMMGRAGGGGGMDLVFHHGVGRGRRNLCLCITLEPRIE